MTNFFCTLGRGVESPPLQAAVLYNCRIPDPASGQRIIYDHFERPRKGQRDGDHQCQGAIDRGSSRLAFLFRDAENGDWGGRLDPVCDHHSLGLWARVRRSHRQGTIGAAYPNARPSLAPSSY